MSSLARPYLAYGAYRADVILRESVVVGLVGATGLGSQLLEALSSFAWDQLLALVAVYAALTLLGEDLSDRARHQLLETAHGDDQSQEVGGAWRQRRAGLGGSPGGGLV
jgi:phosphonate transport system permease protein